MYRYLITDGKIDTINIFITMIKSWIVAFVLSPIIYFFSLMFNIVDKLLLSEHDFMFALLLSIVIDTIIGVYKHWKTGDLNLKKFSAKTFEKLLFIAFGMSLFNLLAYPVKKHNDMIVWYDFTVQLVLLSYPVFNALKNIYIISGKKFPPEFIMNKFTIFNKTGDVKQFYDFQNNNTATSSGDVVPQADATADTDSNKV